VGSEPGVQAFATDPGFTTKPTCDPLGTWTIAFSEELFFAPATMTITRDAQDRIVVASSGIEMASLTADGCELDLRWYDDDGGEEIDGQCFECDHDLQATLTLAPASDEASGTFESEEIGECGQVVVGTAIASRP
jgi:hypothetical protein